MNEGEELMMFMFIMVCIWGLKGMNSCTQSLTFH